VVAVAALLLAGAAVTATSHWLLSRGQAAPSATAFAEDYLRRVVEQVELKTSDREEIAEFFARELGVSMPPPALPGFRVRRAMICLMNGRRGGVVEYEARGRNLSYYVLPMDEGVTVHNAYFDVKRIDNESGFVPALASERGLGVATWLDGEHQHALVGNLPARELRRLAPLFSASISNL
jgi:anti-sigma factor RsiW